MTEIAKQIKLLRGIAYSEIFSKWLLWYDSKAGGITFLDFETEREAINKKKELQEFIDKETEKEQLEKERELAQRKREEERLVAKTKELEERRELAKRKKEEERELAREKELERKRDLEKKKLEKEREESKKNAERELTASKPYIPRITVNTNRDQMKKKSPMRNITINIPEIYDDNIQKLIELKVTSSRSECIRTALREYLHDEFEALELLGFFEKEEQKTKLRSS